MVRCNNATSSVPCKSNEHINSIYNKHMLGINSIKYFQSPDNYESPFAMKKHLDVVHTSELLSKIITIELIEYEMHTDIGLIFSEV